MTESLQLMSCFIVKHFIADFPLQGPFQYRNKGTLGHPGGLLHAMIHMAFTAVILTSFGVHDVYFYCVIEGLAHYFIDFAKLNINKALGWGPLVCEQYWWLLGFDQLLHYMTYVWIIWSVTP